jgi:tetratricopeptide (TPR) repeat protein
MKTSAISLIFSLAMVLPWLIASAQQTPDYDSLVRQGNSQLQGGNDEQAVASATAAIKVNASRWQAYAVAGGTLLNLKRYEEAADQFGRAIERAPAAKQAGLRDLRKQCLLAESGTASTAVSAPLPSSTPSAPATQPEIVLWKTIEHSTNIADFQAYLQQYPNGAYSTLARQHLKDTAILHVIRHSSTAGAMHPYILIDQQRTVEILNGQNVKILLPPGSHTISVGDKDVSESRVSDLVIESGKEYWIKLSFSVGFSKAHSKLTLEEPRTAQTEAAKLVVINFGDAFKN